ncbi:hypothetical protein SDC9_55656 [bioreactor metagenome]|uniref:Uncharacterized protein n=1 Tax=bioreactor metagenome TaxID=1076179 RepID=A0A644WZR2_9ZZZZ|nr:hypothetical protein [Acidaminococcaceae bacterium]
MLSKKIQRLIAALILVGFVGSTGLLVTAEASSHHHRQPQHHDNRRNDGESHSDTGNLVTGLIIGGVIGAVVANNT